MLQTGMRGLIWAIAQSGVVAVALAIGLADGAIGQIVPDDTLGAERSRVTATGDRIEGGAQRGQNLFHSFREFNVGTGQRVYFANPADVRNIFSRVTATNVSNIDGVLGVDGSANLFLMNPNGIVFGRNARLDVGGSFVGTTANAIGFGDRGWFSATSPEAASPLLTIEPSAFLFNRIPHAAIVSNAIASAGVDTPFNSSVFGLRVPDGQSLILLGGDIRINGSSSGGAGLIALGGRVELGGAAGTGKVALSSDQNSLSLGFPDNLVRANVTLSNSALVDVNGEGGGSVQIQAARLVLSETSLIFANTVGARNGENILIRATEAITVDNSAIITGVSADGILINPQQATGKGGDIDIRTRQLTIVSNGRSGFALGQVATNTFGVGNAGNIRIKAERVSLSNGGQLTTDTYSVGKAGDISINASESVEVSGVVRVGSNSSRPGAFPSGIFSETLSQDFNAGHAGNLTISTNRLIVRNRALVSTRTRAAGVGGDIQIRAEHLDVNNQAVVAVNSQGTGQAGNLIVNANDIQLDRGTLTAETRSTSKQEGANIRIQDIDRLLYLQNGSQISARAFDNANGGNVTINANNGFVVARTGANQNNDIIARANAGNGGQVAITAQGILGLEQRSSTPANTTNDIDVSSDQGLQGTVTLNIPNVDPSRGLTELPTAPIDATRQIASACPTNTQEADRLGNFIISRRGGLPPNPTDLLSNDNILTEWVTAGESGHVKVDVPSPASTQAIVEAQGWVVDSQGNVKLVASSAPEAIAPTPCPQR